MLRNIRTLRKVVQRHTYDILTHKDSHLIVLLAAATILVFIIQFGEIWMERPVQGRLCQNATIDVVYTWVNGSDPLFLEQLHKYKAELVEELSKHCSYADCVPSHFVTSSKWLEDEKVLRSIYFRPYGKRENEAIMYRVKIPQGNSHSQAQNWTMINLWSSELAAAYVHHFIQSGVKNPTFHQAHWTSDGSVSDTFGDTNAIIISGLLHSTLALGERTLQKRLTMALQAPLLNFWVYDQKQLLVVQLDSADSVQTVLNFASNITIDGHQVNLSKAYLIMKLAPLETIEDSPTRFADKEELRYSLRSLEKFAPWVRHVYLVTNGQIPYWLDLENPRLTIVTHEAIFPDPSHLPTFNSHAIESHLHRIPGLSSKFLYLNDDMMFGKEVCPDDFFTNANGHKVYLSGSLPDCSDNCPWFRLADGSCDVSCYTSDCSFDGGDCDFSSKEMVGLYDENHNILNNDDANILNENQKLPLNAPKYNLFQHVSIGADIASDKLVSNGKEVNNLLDILIRKGTYKDMCKRNSTSFSENNVNRTSLATGGPDLNLLGKVQELPAHENEGTELLHKTDIIHFINIQPVVENEIAVAVLSKLNKTDISPFKSSNDSNIIIFMEPSTTNSQIFNNYIHYSENGKENILNKSPAHQVFRAKVKSISSEKDKDALLAQSANLHKALSSKLTSAIVSDKAGSDFKSKYGSRLKEANMYKTGHFRKHARLTDGKHKMHGKQVDYNLSNDYETRRSRLHHDLNDHKHLLTMRSEQASVKISASEKVKKKQEFMKVLEVAPHRSSVIPGRKTYNMYTKSLFYVNRLYNQEFGFEDRKTINHVPYFIDIGIMEELQIRFGKEWKLASSFKLRRAQDMQYAFSYFHFLMSNKEPRSVSEIFDLFDTDHSGTWSATEREILLTRLFKLPLNYTNILQFENYIINCSRSLPEHLTGRNIPTPPYERYHNSKLPTVSKSLISNCKPIVNMLKQKFGSKNKNKYKYEILNKTQQDAVFVMLTSDIRKTVTALDTILQDPKKFICLNDDLDPRREKDNAVIRAVLLKTYESLFPEPSEFELPLKFWNRVLHVLELEVWRASRNIARAAIYIFLIILIVLTFHYLFNVQFRWFLRRILFNSRHQPRALSSGHYV